MNTKLFSNTAKRSASPGKFRWSRGISDTFYLAFISIVSVGGAIYIYNDINSHTPKQQVAASSEKIKPAIQQPLEKTAQTKPAATQDKTATLINNKRPAEHEAANETVKKAEAKTVPAQTLATQAAGEKATAKATQQETATESQTKSQAEQTQAMATSAAASASAQPESRKQSQQQQQPADKKPAVIADNKAQNKDQNKAQNKSDNQDVAQSKPDSTSPQKGSPKQDVDVQISDKMADKLAAHATKMMPSMDKVYRPMMPSPQISEHYRNMNRMMTAPMPMNRYPYPQGYRMPPDNYMPAPPMMPQPRWNDRNAYYDQPRRYPAEQYNQWNPGRFY